MTSTSWAGSRSPGSPRRTSIASSAPVLTASDESFNTLLRMGFASAIRREYAWRVSRGESLANLEAFTALAAPDTQNPT